MIIAVIVGDVSANLVWTFFLVILCGALALVARAFSPLLSYKRAESVQFEDADNLYYVRVVPKIKIAPLKRRVRQIRTEEETKEEVKKAAKIEIKPKERPKTEEEKAVKEEKPTKAAKE